MRLRLALLCLLAATACDEKSPIGPGVPLNEQFTLARGDAAAVEGAAIGVQFVQVTNDSRCPADAVCIQGGDALVQVLASGGDDSTLLDLHTGDSRQASAVHQGVRIALVELQPYPFSSRTIAPEEYRATLTATR